MRFSVRTTYTDHFQANISQKFPKKENDNLSLNLRT